MNKTPLLSLLLGLTLMLSACGGGGGSAVTEMKVSMTEFMFEPVEFTVPASQTITLTLENTGAIQHDFVILKAGAEVSIPFNEDDADKVYWQQVVEAGETLTVTFTAPEDPGEYQVLCGVSGHMEAGMTATLTVMP